MGDAKLVKQALQENLMSVLDMLARTGSARIYVYEPAPFTRYNAPVDNFPTDMQTVLFRSEGERWPEVWAEFRGATYPLPELSGPLQRAIRNLNLV